MSGSILIASRLWRRREFQKALNIVNNAPDSRDITGWKPSMAPQPLLLIEKPEHNRYNLVLTLTIAIRSGLDHVDRNPMTGGVS